MLARDYGARYFVDGEVHGTATPAFTRLFPVVFSNDDVDVYDIGVEQAMAMPFTARGGVAASFGRRRNCVSC